MDKVKPQRAKNDRVYVRSFLRENHFAEAGHNQNAPPENLWKDLKHGDIVFNVGLDSENRHVFRGANIWVVFYSPEGTLKVKSICSGDLYAVIGDSVLDLIEDPLGFYEDIIMELDQGEFTSIYVDPRSVVNKQELGTAQETHR